MLNLKKCHSILCIKNSKILINILLKNVTPQTEADKNLKEKVLNDVGDLFNELYYILKDKYNEKMDGLSAEDRKEFHYKKLRLTDDYQYWSENEEEQQTSEKFDKKEPPIKPTKTDVNEETFLRKMKKSLLRKKQT